MTLISHSWPLLGTAVYNSSLRPPRTLWPLPFHATRTDLVKLRVICCSFLDVAEYSAHVLQAYGHGMILCTGGRSFLSLFTAWQPKSMIGRGN